MDVEGKCWTYEHWEEGFWFLLRKFVYWVFINSLRISYIVFHSYSPSTSPNSSHIHPPFHTHWTLCPQFWFSYSEEWNHANCMTMDPTGDHYIKWNKSDWERWMPRFLKFVDSRLLYKHIKLCISVMKTEVRLAAPWSLGEWRRIDGDKWEGLENEKSQNTWYIRCKCLWDPPLSTMDLWQSMLWENIYCHFPCASYERPYSPH